MLASPDDKRLRLPSKPVHFPDPALAALIADLSDALARENAIGIAAPQLGVNRQVALVRHNGRTIVLVNPIIVSSAGTQFGWEGCLSVPHMVGWVERPQEVLVAADDARGRAQRYTATGLSARAMAHEIDHLSGRLYTDLVGDKYIVDTRIHPTPPDVELLA